MIIGYIYPGKPLANVAFKTYGYISMAQALYFLSDLKLGHYMKIPPRAMFIIQVIMLITIKIIWNFVYNFDITADFLLICVLSFLEH